MGSLPSLLAHCCLEEHFFLSKLTPFLSFFHVSLTQCSDPGLSNCAPHYNLHPIPFRCKTLYITKQNVREKWSFSKPSTTTTLRISHFQLQSLNSAQETLPWPFSGHSSTQLPKLMRPSSYRLRVQQGALVTSGNFSWFSGTDTCLIKHSTIPSTSLGTNHYSKLSRLADIPEEQYILFMKVIFMERGTTGIYFTSFASQVTLMTIYGVSTY